MDEKQQGKGNEEEPRFVDRRRFKGDDIPAADEPAAETETRPPAEEPAKEPKSAPKTGAPREKPPQLTEMPDVYSLLSAYVATLGSQAFVWMGLLKDPISGKVAKDMAQAKVAIDTCEFLIGQIQTKLGEPDRRELQRMVDDLKINFTRQISG